MDLAYWKSIIEWDKFIIYVAFDWKRTIRNLFGNALSKKRNARDFFSFSLSGARALYWLGIKLMRCCSWWWCKARKIRQTIDISHCVVLLLLLTCLRLRLILIVYCIYSCAFAREVLLAIVWEHVCPRISKEIMSTRMICFSPFSSLSFSCPSCGRWNVETDLLHAH